MKTLLIETRYRLFARLDFQTISFVMVRAYLRSSHASVDDFFAFDAILCETYHVLCMTSTVDDGIVVVKFSHAHIYVYIIL